VHAVPRNPKDGLRGFFWPRTRYADAAEAAAMAQSIRVALGESM
jgi:histidine triad (HIT) family protein